ncbi:MAG: hypothetical protein JSW42_01295 [Chloroflexota bacterium]|nr:MAG: hypothetical protein JSW42_01295 [Chloroflexota bacterium]
MMNFKLLRLIFAGLVLLAACSSLSDDGVEGAAKITLETNPANSKLPSCPVTQPPKTAFVPPKPWPAQPPGADDFWFGDRDLWTALPSDGSWPQLALGEKFFWWSEEFDVSEDETPDLTVTARRLDREVPSLTISGATNAYHESFNWAMLVGVELASPGCWEFTGQYNDHQLSFVLWVPEG